MRPPISLAVDFQLTDLEYQPLAGIPVRLVFGTPDWQTPDAGHRFVTDSAGAANFTAGAILTRQTRWVPVGFTAFSVPRRTDHLSIAAELQRAFSVESLAWTVQFLYVMDVWRFADGACSTQDLSARYARDQRGHFTRRLQPSPDDPRRWVIPDLPSGAPPGLVTGDAYQSWNFGLDQDADDPSGSRWKLKLAFRIKSRAAIMAEGPPE